MLFSNATFHANAWPILGRIHVVEAAVVTIGAFALKKVAADLPGKTGHAANKRDLWSCGHLGPTEKKPNSMLFSSL